ncbi:MAG TPA: caspase family protein, partial [Thermoanaerobaculia bacterium]
MRKLLLFALLTLIACPAGAEPHRRALLIGINDYTSARPVRPLLTDRDWPNLTGAANDVRMMEELLVLLYGFERKDIATLTNQQASRVAIVQALETLAAAASKGDTVFFYFAGHGSQVRNTRSAEPDRLDESIVPADSRAGALDIRDKELRRVFNRILDRGARLTVFLDSCHSGSGARGLPTGARPRGIAPDLRDVADSGDPGPSPEERGALVLSASPDYELAWEVTGDDGNRHGAFSWAFARSIRAAAAGEPAMETFLRAQALLHGDRRYQDAVIGGGSEATRNPFLGTRTDRRGERAIVAVERIRGDGTIELAGGWANGLSIGTELRIDDLRLTVTRINGLGRAHARVKSNVRQLPRALAVGALAEVSGWAAPPGRPLRVWMPR